MITVRHTIIKEPISIANWIGGVRASMLLTPAPPRDIAVALIGCSESIFTIFTFLDYHS
jgi:hypothetical protein